MQNPNQNPEKASECKRIDKRVAYKGNQLKFSYVDYQIDERIVKNYEMVERSTYKNEEGTSSIEVIGLLRNPGDKIPKLILNVQYRPPADSLILEFPSGLLLEGELPEEAALRVLKNVTGYTANNILREYTSPSMWTDPWKSNEKTQAFIVNVDPNLELNLNINKNNNVWIVDLDSNVLQNVEQVANQQQYTVETKLWTFLCGIAMIRKIKEPQ